MVRSRLPIYAGSSDILHRLSLDLGHGRLRADWPKASGGPGRGGTAAPASLLDPINATTFICGEGTARDLTQ